MLPLEETLVIADELGLKHPTDPKTNEPIVMTTDFLLTVDKGQGFIELARTIKMKDELLNERVLCSKFVRFSYCKINICMTNLMSFYFKPTLTDIKDRSFSFLDDDITPRKYIVAYLQIAAIKKN